MNFGTKAMNGIPHLLSQAYLRNMWMRAIYSLPNPHTTPMMIQTKGEIAAAAT